MLASHEFMQYVMQRQPLRVRSPASARLSTYWLALPFKYTMPLMILSPLLYWAASQAIFVVLLDVVGLDCKVDLDSSISTMECSSDTTVLAMILSTAIFVSGTVLAFRDYPAGKTLASSSYIAITAAYHARPDDPDAYFICEMGSVENGVSRCASSSQVVAPPIPGRRYARLQTSEPK